MTKNSLILPDVVQHHHNNRALRAVVLPVEDEILVDELMPLVKLNPPEDLQRLH